MQTRKIRCWKWRNTCDPLRIRQTDGVKGYWVPSVWSVWQFLTSMDLSMWGKLNWDTDVVPLHFRRRIVTRCLACIVLSLFPESEAQRKDYEAAMDELKVTAKSKKYADVKANALLAIDIVEKNTESTNSTKENICAIIRLFYNNCYFTSLEDIWVF